VVLTRLRLIYSRREGAPRLIPVDNCANVGALGVSKRPAGGRPSTGIGSSLGMFVLCRVAEREHETDDDQRTDDDAGDEGEDAPPHGWAP
jgi:hypothetical protein